MIYNTKLGRFEWLFLANYDNNRFIYANIQIIDIFATYLGLQFLFMHSLFENVSPEVEEFYYGAYCSASERSEIDTPFHLHNKGQFVYAEKGTLHINTENKQFFLPVEHFTWIPRNTEHRIWTNNTQIIMFSIYFDTHDEQSDFFQKMGVYAVTNLLHEMIAYARKWNGYIGKEKSEAYKFMQAFKAILPEISRIKQLPMLGFVKPNSERLQTIMDYMKLHLEDQLELNSLASKFGFSTRSLSRLFSSEGINFTQYLQSLRVVKAIELLSDKNWNVNNVSIKVGYESPSSFSNIFMRFTGIRPSDYANYRHKKRK